MKNLITASVEFYFKGKKTTSSLIIDLDKLMEKNSDLPELYSLLAQKINLSAYSYEYEMMLTETIKFDHPKGMSKLYLKNEIFDFHSFSKAWQEKNLLESLEKIASEYLSLENLIADEQLKNALVAAYKLGLNNSKSLSS